MKKEMLYLEILKKYLNKAIYFIVFFILIVTTNAQNNLQYYIDNAIKNSATLKENNNLIVINELNKKLNDAEFNTPQISLTSNYLFVPYFNNNGNIISSNPSANAIGYDIGLTNGGLYSAQINIEKNIFNGGIKSAFEKRTNIMNNQYKYNYELEKRNIQKQITDLYLNAYKTLMLYKLTQETTKNLEEQLKITGELVEQGYTKSQNYLLLKIEYQSQQILLKEQYMQYKSNLIQLNLSCGIQDTITVFIEPIEMSIDSKQSNFNYLTKYNLDSLDIKNQQEILETKYKPQVRLFFNAGLNAVEINNIQRKFGFSAGIDFLMPIYDGGQKDITRMQNEINLNTINNYKNLAELNIKLQKQNSLSNIETIKNSLEDTEQQIEEYKNLIMVLNKQLQKGNILALEYLTVLRNFVDIQKTKIEKEINLLMEINNYNYWN